MVDAAFIAASAPPALAAGTLGIVAATWATRAPRLAIVLLGVALVAGQLVRFVVPGQGGGLLLSDVAVVLVIFAALSSWWQHRNSGAPRQLSVVIGQLFVPFVVWSLLTLVINAPHLAASELLIATLYWLRLTGYLLIIPALLYLAADPGIRRVLTRTVVVTISVLVLISGVQLWVVRDLSVLGQGWDSHLGRAVATWLDPNFLGAFFGLAVVYLLSRLSRTDHRLPLVLLIIAASGALLLTQSRSALVAGVTTALVISPFLLVRLSPRRSSRDRLVQFLTVAVILAVVGAAGIGLLGERALGVLTFDQTVMIRLASLGTVWELVTDHWLLGVGYNAYQFTALSAGLVGDFSIHSRAGADSSLLTLWVTTGLVGVVLFFIPWLAATAYFIRTWLRSGHHLSLAAAAAIVLLFVHSQFVNSFLYTHLLLVVSMLVTLAAASRASTDELPL